MVESKWTNSPTVKAYMFEFITVSGVNQRNRVVSMIWLVEEPFKTGASQETGKTVTEISAGKRATETWRSHTSDVTKVSVTCPCLTMALHQRHLQSCRRRTLPHVLSQTLHLAETGRFPSNHWWGIDTWGEVRVQRSGVRVEKTGGEDTVKLQENILVCVVCVSPRPHPRWCPCR